MQRSPEFKRRGGTAVPLIFLLLLGLLFLGIYMLADRISPDTLHTPKMTLIFLGAYLGAGMLVCLAFLLREYKYRKEQHFLETLNTRMHHIFKETVRLPYAIVDEQGRVRALNSALQGLIHSTNPFYHGFLSDFCNGVTLQDMLSSGINGQDARSELSKLIAEANSASSDVSPAESTAPTAMSDGTVVKIANGRYIARAYATELQGHPYYLVTFTDVSELLDLKEKTERDMPAVAYIDVDNLEELTQYTHANYREASRKVDDVLAQWAADMDGYLREYERDRYIMLFSQEKLRVCEEDKFVKLLDDIRSIRLGEYAIPVTVSVGISVMDATMEQRAREADSALSMALQRGGDQVAVRRRDGIRYYGGQTRPFQRRSRVTSRVVANYLLTKISESDNLLVMGHKNPDFDSIGSSIGIAQFGLLAGIPTKIVMDLDNQNFQIATERLALSPQYKDMFISSHQGLDLVRSGTLLIITDANNFRIIESPEIANSVRQVSGKIAIIDHHRQAGEYDFVPIVNYIDAGASSACELVAEMLEQSDNDADSRNSQLVSDEVASVMLSGIMLDTGGFTHNTSSRTLDAARYLYGHGANAEYVNSFFHQNYADYVCERSFSGCTLLENDTVGLTWSQGTGRGADDRVAAAKEADRLLTVKGVRASFALIVVDNAVHISGRSDGTINVQLILEKLGGGGRFDSAGTALSGISLEKAVEDLKEAIRTYCASQTDTPYTV